MTQYKLSMHYSKYVDVYVEARDREHAQEIADEFYQAVGLIPALSDPEHFPLPQGVLSFEGDDEDLESTLVFSAEDDSDGEPLSYTGFGLFDV